MIGKNGRLACDWLNSKPNTPLHLCFLDFERLI